MKKKYVYSKDIFIFIHEKKNKNPVQIKIRSKIDIITCKYANDKQPVSAIS